MIVQEGPPLSAREVQVLRLASKGLTDEAIAVRLGLSSATVGTYWGRIRVKRGKTARTELVADYLQEQSAVVLERLGSENARLRSELQAVVESESKLRSALKLLKVVLETAPDAILVVDREGYVKLANDAAGEILGYDAEAMRGAHLRKFVPERLHGTHHQLRKEYMESPERRQMGVHRGTTALHSDGTEIPIAAMLNAFEIGETMLVTCMIREVLPEPTDEQR